MAKAEITLQASDPHSPPAECGRALAKWSDDAGNRYHVYLVKAGGCWQLDPIGPLKGRYQGPRRGETVYKNPPLDGLRFFRTRYLEPKAAASRAVVKEALRLANETTAIIDDAARRRQDRVREEAMERHKDATSVREAFARALADSFAAGEISRNKFTELVDLAADLPDESWLTLARAVRQA